MAVTVDQTLLPELQRYGAFDVAACFNCGNCTAVCPNSEPTSAVETTAAFLKRRPIHPKKCATRPLSIAFLSVRVTCS